MTIDNSDVTQQTFSVLVITNHTNAAIYQSLSNATFFWKMRPLTH